MLIPSYTTFDASLFFERSSYRISLKGNNLSDEKYWSYRITPQAPRNFVGSIAYKF
ncbi:TonB-dependent receptor [Pedobacter sp. MC2016-14]|uniref:TonB-dependent receptor n=1 Tax=Pedobacter sp. MC2016-14 TaxID=2897327 RepID=UPI001E4EEFF0|nr:TonB-dependent receptor [Pedobacter sp. MC2016-14]MCD0487584.1 TonB-dependent receptor [Pedobacter sp. MC2016-14]